MLRHACALWMGLIVTPAWAGPLANQFVHMAPVGEVEGNGDRIMVQILVLERDGTPSLGVEWKLETRDGDAGAVSELGEGLYEFHWVAPRVSAPQSAVIEMKGKKKDKSIIRAKQVVQVIPAVDSSLQAWVSPQEMTGGAEPHATVAFNGGHPDAQVVGRTSAGTLADWTALGDGDHRVRWSASDTRESRVVLVAGVDRQGVSDSFGYGLLRQNSVQELRLKAEIGEQLLVRIGEQEFGPVQGAGSREIRLPVVVPPGVESATVLTVTDEGVQEAPIELSQKPQQTYFFIPPPRSVPADPGVEVPIRFIALDAEGTPNTMTPPKPTSSAGKMGTSVHVRDGIWRSMLTPPAEPGEVTIELAGGADPDNPDRVTTTAVGVGMGVGVSENPVYAVVLSPWSSQVRNTGASELGITVATVDKFGLAIPNRTVDLSVRQGGGQIPATVKTGDDGTAEVYFTSGKEETLGVIDASSGAARGTVGVIQSPEEVQWALEPSRSGTRDLQALETAWQVVVNEAQAQAQAD